MKAIHICILIGSCLASFCFSQKRDSIVAKQKIDSVKLIAKKDTLKRSFIAFDQVYIGLDIFNPVNGLFTSKKGFNGMLTFRVKKKWHAAVEMGYDTNTMDENGWNVEVKGPYFKLGFNWYVNHDNQNSRNGFLIGARVASSTFSQQINQFPIYHLDNVITSNAMGSITNVTYGSLSANTASAYWIELAIGGKIQVLKSKFYADFFFQPKMLISASSSDDSVTPLVIPGFGRDKSNFNMGIYWGISYQIR